MSSQDGVATLYGVPTKYVSLVTLVVQNSSLVLIMRYSRIIPGPKYLSSTAVVLSELLNLPTLSDPASSPSASSAWSPKQLWSDLFSAKSGFVKLLIPAILYTLQNNLQFVAASNLDAATFQVTYQCKILTTALFAVLMLGQILSPKKWLSLVILTAGVGCVQIPTSSDKPVSAQQGNYLLGMTAVAVACMCSGFAGVYFERVLKTGQSSSIWIRNIQLSVGCLGIALVGAFVWDGQAIRDDGFFQGYNPIVVATICTQAAGGLIVAMVIKYADNILKGFATSLSIILSTVASIFIFDFVPNIYFLLGSILVFLATYLYSMPDAPKAVDPATPDDSEKGLMPRAEDEDDDTRDRQETRNPSQPFRDDRDPVPGGESTQDLSSSFGPDDGRGSRNFSPSLIQTTNGEKEVLPELGHVG